MDNCILCGKEFMIGEDGNELGFCMECQKDEDFPYDLDAYYKDYDTGKVAFKGFDTMSRGILEAYKTKLNYETFKKMNTEQKLSAMRNLVMNSTRKELEKLKEIVEHEIHLSDVAIKEGQEKDDRNNGEKSLDAKNNKEIYAVYDEQINEYLHTAKNKSYKEAVELAFDYWLSGADLDEEDVEKMKDWSIKEKKDMLEYQGFRVDKLDKPMKDVTSPDNWSETSC